MRVVILVRKIMVDLITATAATRAEDMMNNSSEESRCRLEQDHGLLYTCTHQDMWVTSVADAMMVGEYCVSQPKNTRCKAGILLLQRMLNDLRNAAMQGEQAPQHGSVSSWVAVCDILRSVLPPITASRRPVYYFQLFGNNTCSSPHTTI